MKILFALFALLSFSLSSACSNQTSSDASDDFFALVSERACNPNVSCLGAFQTRTSVSRAYGSCEEAQNVFREIFASSSLRFNAAEAEKCVAFLRANPCANSGDLACRSVFQGTIPLGQACRGVLDCTPDAFCDLRGDACPSTCVARKALGADCLVSNECQIGDLCVAGKCKAVGAGFEENEACESFNQSGGCRAGLICTGSGTTNYVCKPAPTTTRGGPCNGLSCNGEDVCITQDFVNGICSAPIALGQACNTGWTCVSGSTCLERTCQTLRNRGEACTSSSDCKSKLSCVEGICGDGAAVGQTCSDQKPCAFPNNCSSGPNRVCVSASSRC